MMIYLTNSDGEGDPEGVDYKNPFCIFDNGIFDNGIFDNGIFDNGIFSKDMHKRSIVKK